MPENAEQIEARLCAYIDGELDDAEKVQIEAHLAANPSHATLLGQLMRQKQAIGRLPREHAPADLTDELQAQLEREVLLKIGPVATDTRSQGHWSRWLAAAAIFALASGLGIVVYTVLPKGQPAIVAMDTAPRRPAPMPGTLADPSNSREAAVLDAASDLERGKTQAVARKGIAADSPVIASPAAVGVATADKGGAPALEEAPQTVVITVTAGDLKQTNRDVLAYLSSQDLNYELADGQTRVDVSADRHGAFYQLADQRARRALAPQESQQRQAALPGDGIRLAGAAAAKSTVAFGGGAQIEAKTQEQVAPAPAEKADGSLFAAGQTDVSSRLAPTIEDSPKPGMTGLAKDLAQETAVVASVPLAPTTQPAALATVVAQAEALSMRGGGGGAGGASAPRDSAAAFGMIGQQAHPSEPGVLGDALAQDRAALDNGRVIIVRNINGQQVAGLKDVLFRPAANQASPANVPQTEFRFARAEGESAKQESAGQANGVTDFLARPARAIDLLGDMFGALSAATQPAQSGQAFGAVDGMADQQRYNCVIVLQNAPAADATPAVAADPSAGPATRPAAAGEEPKTNEPATEK